MDTIENNMNKEKLLEKIKKADLADSELYIWDYFLKNIEDNKLELILKLLKEKKEYIYFLTENLTQKFALFHNLISPKKVLENEKMLIDRLLYNIVEEDIV